MKEYKVIGSYLKDTFNEKLNEAIAEGWVLSPKSRLISEAHEGDVYYSILVYRKKPKPQPSIFIEEPETKAVNEPVSRILHRLLTSDKNMSFMKFRSYVLQLDNLLMIDDPTEHTLEAIEIIKEKLNLK